MVALSSFIRFHAQRTPAQVALIYGEDRIVYAELMCRIETTAGWLAARGIGPGDVVALLMKNSPAFLELTFAISHLGAVSLPLNYRLAAEEVDYFIDNAGARLLLWLGSKPPRETGCTRSSTVEPFSSAGNPLSMVRCLRRLRIFGQQDKLRADRSKGRETWA